MMTKVTVIMMMMLIMIMVIMVMIMTFRNGLTSTKGPKVIAHLKSRVFVLHLYTISYHSYQNYNGINI